MTAARCTACGGESSGEPATIKHAPDCLERLTPHSTPECKADALHMALKWGSEWSHWNDHCSMTDNTSDNAGADRRLAWVHCAQHDAAEVARLAALWTMLPDEHPSIPF